MDPFLQLLQSIIDGLNDWKVRLDKVEMDASQAKQDAANAMLQVTKLAEALASVLNQQKPPV